MKQIVFSVLCLLVTSVGFSQQINILIKDAFTNEPLPFANVFLKGAAVGTSTDIDGSAILNYREKNPDTLVSSYVGYLTKELPVNLGKSFDTIILLTPSATKLSEVVVTYQKPLKTKQILKKAIKNTAKNYSNVPVNLRGLYRETLKEDEHYIYLNEAVVDVFYSEYPQNKLSRKIWEDWYDDDTYAFEFDGGFFSEFPTHFNTQEDQVSLSQARTSQNWSPYYFDKATYGGPLSLTGKDFIKYRYDFLNPSNFSKYVYETQESELVNSQNCYVIHFYPKESSRKMVFDYSKKQNRAVYVGKLYIERSSFALVKMEFQLAQNVDFGFYKRHVPLNEVVTVNYQLIKDIWYLHNITRVKTRKYGSKYHKSGSLYNSSQEFIVTGIEADSVVALNEEKVWKHTRLTGLRNKEEPYHPEFWAEYEKDNYPKLPQKIKRDLEKETPLNEQYASRFQQKKDLPVPVAKKVGFTFNYPLENVEDPYQWFADSGKKTEFFQYIEQENQFAKNYIIPYKSYQRQYFDGLNNFYPKDTSSTHNLYPKGSVVLDEDSTGNVWVYEYQDSINRVSILNYTRFTDQRKNGFVTSIKKNDNLIGVNYTNDGGLNNYLTVLTKGSSIVVDSVENVYSYEWYNDSILLYSKRNSLKRSDKLFQRNVRTQREVLLLFEEDLTYDISVSSLKGFLVAKVESKEETEVFLIKKDEIQTSLQLVSKRESGVKYEISEFNDRLYMLTNKHAVNNRILEKNDSGTWVELVPHNQDVLITNFVVTENHVLLNTFKNALPEMLYKSKTEKNWQKIEFKEEIFEVELGAVRQGKVNIQYSTPHTPFKIYQFDLGNKVLTQTKATNIKRGYYLNYLKTKQVWAKSKDGSKVPITVTKSSYSKKKHKGLILKVYGAYGNYPMGNGFSAEDMVLLNDGFTIACAHVRGSITKGNEWYADGKLMRKENGFNDYIACAEYLIKKELTTPNQLIGYGNSAGALILGTVMNRRPELFNTVILDHPFLDVLTTMMNDSLPLTTDEYKEWGNPSDSNVYRYIKNYSPYQNIKNQAYPNVLLLASSNDFQTPVWQVAKYAAKLKMYNTSASNIVFKTELGTGHYGSTSGKEWIKSLSFNYAFVYGNIFE